MTDRPHDHHDSSGASAAGSGTPTPSTPPGYGTPPPPPSGYGQAPRPPSGYGEAPPPPSGYGQAPPPPSGYGDPAQLSASDERTWGMLAHLSGLLASFVALGFLGPLVVMLIQGGKSGFVRRHAVEALNFQLMLLIATVVAVFLSIVTLGVALIILVPLAVLAGIAALVVIILASVKANNGEEYRYPVNWRIVK